LHPSSDSADSELLQKKGAEHERLFLEGLRASGHGVVEIDTRNRTLSELTAETAGALRSGSDYVYQAALSDTHWAGYADFLERVPRPSRLGDFSYEIIDTKLKRSPSPQHVLQLSVYAQLLTELQGLRPEFIHIVLGDRRRVTLRLADYYYYAERLGQRLTGFIADPWSTHGEPVAACNLCRWRDHCSAQWDSDDNLCLVAGISKGQRKRLEAAGIRTLTALADNTVSVPRLASETLAKLTTQARLQNDRRQGGGPKFELKPIATDRGLARLPEPDRGDLFFDMEGDPYFDSGLEYLFGIYCEAPEFGGYKAFWAHDRDAERIATADVLAFFAEHLRKYPKAHIYHYAQYEETALKTLASRHGVGEAPLDQLLREDRFVDLYRIVHQGIFASEPGYSIKNMEVFYRPARDEIVKTGMDSVVHYEVWRETRDAKLLEDIRAYNETDCRSTWELRNWLVSTVRPRHLEWYRPRSISEGSDAEQDARTVAAEKEREDLRLLMEKASGRLGRDVAELLFELAWFHRREDKPQWWAMFDRADRESGELIEDYESLGGLTPVDEPLTSAQSQIRTYHYPDQETKLRSGSNVRLRSNLKSVSLVELNRVAKIAKVKFGPSAGDPPECVDLIPGGPIDNKMLQQAVLRVVESFSKTEIRYKALDDLLRRKKPRLTGMPIGGPLLATGEDIISGTVRIVSLLDNSCLAIQGPPGTGKTHVSSHAILALLKAGKRVGVTSNSHKAIDNLLIAVANRAREESFPLDAVKKISTFDGDTINDPLVQITTANGSVALQTCTLVGGTAWLFARPEHDQAFDYLFVDEAGQVSLANILATGCAAKNIVLVGDPLQLAQPIQGTHPGETGSSSLQYLLAEFATVPPDRGIFLPVSRRMHPAVCNYISNIVYEGRLRSDDGAARQTLLIHRPHEILSWRGIRFVEIVHEGNSQSSEEEADEITRLWHELLGQSFQDRDGNERKMGPKDILVVSPYNAQVNLLTGKLPTGAKVGTVDRFQGQEAPVCLISMATSSGEEMPRNIEFLFSVNRLNVAISRAQVLAVVVASPSLLDVPCATIEQMRLVNALCAVRVWSMSQ